MSAELAADKPHELRVVREAVRRAVNADERSAAAHEADDRGRVGTEPLIARSVEDEKRPACEAIIRQRSVVSGERIAAIGMVDARYVRLYLELVEGGQDVRGGGLKAMVRRGASAYDQCG